MSVAHWLFDSWVQTAWCCYTSHMYEDDTPSLPFSPILLLYAVQCDKDSLSLSLTFIVWRSYVHRCIWNILRWIIHTFEWGLNIFSPFLHDIYLCRRRRRRRRRDFLTSHPRQGWEEDEKETKLAFGRAYLIFWLCWSSLRFFYKLVTWEIQTKNQPEKEKKSSSFAWSAENKPLFSLEYLSLQQARKYPKEGASARSFQYPLLFKKDRKFSSCNLHYFWLSYTTGNRVSISKSYKNVVLAP